VAEKLWLIVFTLN